MYILILFISGEGNIRDLNSIDPDLNVLSQPDCHYYNYSNIPLTNSSISPNAPILSLFHANVRSLNRNFQELHNCLNIIESPFSIVALTETWLNESNESLNSLSNYTSINAVRKNRVGGGISLYINESLKFKKYPLHQMNQIIECLFIEIICPNPSNNIVIGVIYRPPSGSISDFIVAMSDILNHIHSKRKTCYLLGDFNIDLYKYHSNPDTAEFFDLLYSYSFIPLIDKATRVSSSTASVIDNIFTNQSTTTHKTGVIKADISDHYPVFSISEMSNSIKTDQILKVRSFKPANIEKFISLLRAESWENTHSSNNAQMAFSCFINTLRSHYNSSFPIIEKKPSKKDSNQWIMQGLKVSIKQKNKLYIQFKNRPTLHNKTLYNQYKNKLRSLINTAKKTHYERLISTNKNNCKKMWDIIKEVINNKKAKSDIDEILINNEICTDKQKITDSFNNYFINIGPELANSIPPSVGHHLDYMGNPNNNSLYLTPITPTEVTNQLLKLKRSAPGNDEIDPAILKQVSVLIAIPLTYAFNLCFEQSIVPNELKIARVTPVPKAGDLKLTQNYRPISILPVLSKIFEKLVYTRIYSFLQQNNILNENQFGFRKGYSTEMALSSFIEKITSSLDKGQHSVGVFLDLKKAFDTVNFNILFDKLSHIGIRGNPLNLLKSYLNNRKQTVTISSFKSPLKNTLCGVPQGSILGPLLFLIYINDLPNALTSSFPIMYADDTNIFYSGKSLTEIENSLNSDLTTLSNWLSANKLSLNLNKTHSMLFTLNNRLKSYKPKIKINNSQIESINSTTFLGVIIDQNFSWSKHISHLTNKLSKAIGILKKASHAFNKSTLRMLYHSFLQPYFNYCILIWGNAADIHLNKLNLLQRRAIRIISNAQFLDHTTPLFAQQNILKLKDLYYQRCAMFTYKIYSHQFPTSFSNEFKMTVLNHNHNTRALSQGSLNIPAHRTTLKQKTLKYKSIKLYNEFLRPNNYHIITSIASLNKILHKRLISSYAPSPQ